MKIPPTRKEELVDTQFKKLKLNNTLLTEEVKVLERRLDFMQDNSAKIVIEQQSLVKSMRFFTKIAGELMDKQPDEKPKSEPKDNLYS